jgi:hypothetical protein
MDCLKRLAQPDLTEIGKNWEQFDVIDRLGAFGCILQQLTYSNGGLMKKAV